MTLFVCNACDCVDQIGLAYPSGRLPTTPLLQQCSQCQTGTWHNLFPKEKYQPGIDHVSNRPTGIGLS